MPRAWSSQGREVLQCPSARSAATNGRVSEEEKRVDDATSPGMALVHRQVAMLYRSELAILRKTHTATADEEPRRGDITANRVVKRLG